MTCIESALDLRKKLALKFKIDDESVLQYQVYWVAYSSDISQTFIEIIWLF